MESSACKNCRRAGDKLFLKGDRCLSPKCALIKHNSKPGTKTGGRAPKKSEYGLQLQEKQKAKAEYGLREKQFHLYFEKAAKSQVATGEALLQNLEIRLDNVIFRLGWASSRAQARQIVNHGHMLVDGKPVDIPSYQVKIGQIIETKNTELVERFANPKATIPAWLKAEGKGFKAEIKAMPVRADIEIFIDEQLIVEFYSR